MSWYQEKYRVEPARLDGYDYASPGYYFVTLCSHGWHCLFGTIKNGEMILYPNGRIVGEEWEKTLALRSELQRDESQIMPNHFHAIVHIVATAPKCRDVARYVSTNGESEGSRYVSTYTPKPRSLPAIVRAFKSAVTQRMHAVGFSGPVWQSRYYDHVVRDEVELSAIRRYIRDNPRNWESEGEMPEPTHSKNGQQPL